MYVRLQLGSPAITTRRPTKTIRSYLRNRNRPEPADQSPNLTLRSVPQEQSVTYHVAK